MASVTNELKRTHELWGRIAAKEAARRLWLEAGGPSVYPADLAIVSDPHGKPALVSLANPEMPAREILIDFHLVVRESCGTRKIAGIAFALPRRNWA